MTAVFGVTLDHSLKCFQSTLCTDLLELSVQVLTCAVSGLLLLGDLIFAAATIYYLRVPEPPPVIFSKNVEQDWTTHSHELMLRQSRTEESE